MIKKIAIYGKGGIGKSTTVANLSAVYANNDLNCLVIGCDPKADTTRTLCGRRIPTVVDTLKNNRKPSEEDIIVKGYNDILCVESGGPEPGVGCAGRGVIVAMKRLENLGVFDKDLDVVIYDVLGDVVCGGFSVPLREKYADEVIIVTINRSNLIQESELDAKTVVEKYPESKEASEYDALATNIMENKVFTTPEPMDDEEFEKFFKSFLE